MFVYIIHVFVSDQAKLNNTRTLFNNKVFISILRMSEVHMAYAGYIKHLFFKIAKIKIVQIIWNYSSNFLIF